MQSLVIFIFLLAFKGITKLIYCHLKQQNGFEHGSMGQNKISYKAVKVLHSHTAFQYLKPDESVFKHCWSHQAPTQMPYVCLEPNIYLKMNQRCCYL